MTTIRFATTQDAADVAAIYAPAVRDRATSFELEPPTPDEMALRIQATTQTPWLVCEHERRVIGYAYAGAYRKRPAYQWAAEVSAYVHDDYHRCGIGRGLYTSLFALLRLQGFCTLYAAVTLPNPASVALHETFGFTAIGVFHRAGYKHGQWHDVAWLEHALAADESEPNPLRSLEALRTDPLSADLFAAALAAGQSGLHLR